MTWEELCKKAKEMGARILSDAVIMKLPYNVYKDADTIVLRANGNIRATFIENDCVVIRDLSFNRTPDQMYAIMEALIDKDISVPSKGENEKLQKKLEIAKKALKEISVSLWDEMECRGCAKKALKEMEI